MPHNRKFTVHLFCYLVVFVHIFSSLAFKKGKSRLPLNAKRKKRRINEGLKRFMEEKRKTKTNKTPIVVIKKTMPTLIPIPQTLVPTTRKTYQKVQNKFTELFEKSQIKDPKMLNHNNNKSSEDNYLEQLRERFIPKNFVITTHPQNGFNSNQTAQNNVLKMNQQLQSTSSESDDLVTYKSVADKYFEELQEGILPNKNSVNDDRLQPLSHNRFFYKVGNSAKLNYRYNIEWTDLMKTYVRKFFREEINNESIVEKSKCIACICTRKTLMNGLPWQQVKNFVNQEIHHKAKQMQILQSKNVVMIESRSPRKSIS